LKIIFVDLQQKLVSAWQEEITRELPSTLLEQASRTISVAACQAHIQDFLQSTQVDCMVSPANSFGLMDGGLDLEISKYYGGIANLIPVVRSALVDEWCGQQNVGTCLLVDAQKLIQSARQGEQAKNAPRYIAHVPTMRVPKVLHPDDDIAYRCTWALLTAVRKHNIEVAKQGQNTRHERINSVLCAGFGTGSGQFPLDECARQMVLAVKHFAERTSKSSTEEDDLRGSSGLMTLWDKAEKIEDAVCNFVPETKAGETPSSPSIFEKVFGK
jgi:O-acetyl-ADP-ribose deacetylase (regulator of RNase III)